MDGQFYNDLNPPFIITDPASVTLSTTLKALYPISNIRAMGKDFWWAGKKIEIRVFGRITTSTTPGNLTLNVLYGTGADNNGTSVVASAAQTLIASQTNLSWFARFIIHCRSIGSAGTLFGTGNAFFNTAVIAAGDFLMPASAPAASASVDLTVASNVVSLQASRSGSTAETMQVHDMEVLSLN